jgi:hypothetical protein
LGCNIAYTKTNNEITNYNVTHGLKLHTLTIFNTNFDYFIDLKQIVAKNIHTLKSKVFKRKIVNDTILISTKKCLRLNNVTETTSFVDVLGKCIAK